MKRMLVAALAAMSMLSTAYADGTPSLPGAKAYIIEPKAGAEVTSPFVVRFGLSGMGIAPAGVEKAGTGHHHLLIDQKLADPTTVIPADDKHKHFGNGQTEASVTLSPGQHTLQLFLGDHNHIPHTPPVASEVVTITVK